MPGIIGGYKKKLSNISQFVDEMVVSVCAQQHHHIDKYLDIDEKLFLGRISLGITNPIAQPIYDLKRDNCVIFHGELYHETGKKSDPEYILNRYLDNGDLFVKDLNGIFHFAIFDKKNHKIKLYNDHYGLQPLYYSINDQGILFAGDIKALITVPGVSKEIDLESFADLFHYGYILGDKTLFKGIKVLPAASILTYNIINNEFIIDRYFNLEDQFLKKGEHHGNIAIDDVVQSLINSIKIRSKEKASLGLSLSGGIDSRAILSAIGEHSKDIYTYTLGLSGCADEIIADKIAAIANTKHKFLKLDQSYINSFYQLANDTIALSEGMYLPHESTEMLATKYFETAPYNILLRGHGGEIAKASLAYPVRVTKGTLRCNKGEEILKHIYKIANKITDSETKTLIFNESVKQVMIDSPYQALKSTCQKVSETLNPEDVCIYFYIDEYIRRQVTASLAIFRSQMEIRLPFIDKEFVSKVLKLPLSERNTGEVHSKLIKRCFPELIKIANSNTGAPLDAGPLHLWLVDKYNSVMKKLGVEGYRHYTEFQKWFKQGFKDNCEQILFSEETASRGLYDIDNLRNIFDDHVAGRKNYGYLIGTIVGIELWYRNFVD